ncbi:DUF2399 domain-containing protein [Rhizobium grahamii]|uniref:DUF2399 domain-containing protein n=1 Tax=Rhizobium grahamii TaxID=1120045 RepID=A0A5Q0C6A3_9HYPH|nr:MULTISPECIES: Wadjet anti-phage system protein JetD domain-containing protein [Rhizobium]QFY61478.1 DUF2399 domain-containing protein [Rhizobium grahamii]QRM49369.1 DUF2399 domain-containing protein [Rhizobium sp. BG6]
MKHVRFGDAARLLHNLLDRYEARPSIPHPLSYADEAAFPSVEARDRFVETIRAAEKLGAVSLENTKAADADGLRIRLLDADALYRHLDRRPSHQQVEATLADLYQLPNIPKAAHEVLDEIASAWARNVRKFGLVRSDTASVRNALALACGLQERVKDAAAVTVDFRSFSRSVGADSKALDRLATSVVAIHSRLYPSDIATATLDSDEFLATFGVARTPQPFLLSGPIAIHGVKLPNLVYYGFPPDQAAAVTLADSVDYVLTIENYTSFIRHARECNGNWSGLILYTGGFPARSHLDQILRLCREAGAPTYHWGDLDAGGVRIFAHLEKALRHDAIRLRPHLMDAGILARYGVPATANASTPPYGGDDSMIKGLWRALREAGLVLEQESLSPQRP